MTWVRQWACSRNSSAEFQIVIREKETLKKTEKDLLEELIRDRLLDQEIKKLGLSVTEAEVDLEIDRVGQGAGISREQVYVELNAKVLARPLTENLFATKSRR